MSTLEEHTSYHRKKLISRTTKNGIMTLSEMPYERYLNSTLWREIRDWVVAKYGDKCAICSKKAEEVHHHDYEEATLLGLNENALVALCSRCHHLIEFDDQRNKRDALDEKRAVFESCLISHKMLVLEGFQVAVARLRSSIEVNFLGSKDYLKFLDCQRLSFHFVLRCVKGDDVAIPMPFGMDKFAQQSGATIRLKNSGKKIASIGATREHIQIKMTKHCEFPFENRVRDFLNTHPYVRVIS
jgi:hypothetical protein